MLPKEKHFFLLFFFFLITKYWIPTSESNHLSDCPYASHSKQHTVRKNQQSWYSKTTRLPPTQFCEVTLVSTTSHFPPSPTILLFPHAVLTQLKSPKASRTSQELQATWRAMPCSVCTTTLSPPTANYSGSKMSSQPSSDLYSRRR